jgi:hypothetical protein
MFDDNDADLDLQVKRTLNTIGENLQIRSATTPPPPCTGRVLSTRLVAEIVFEEFLRAVSGGGSLEPEE